MLILAFILCMAAHFFQAVWIGGPTLLAFSPFLAACLLKTEAKTALWLATLAGLSVDLFSEDPMGLHALNYVITSVLLYAIKKRLSFEEPLHLGLYTMIISWASTILQLFLLFLFDRRVPVHGKWALIDLFCMPVIDGLYALIWITGPLMLWQRLHYKWVIYWIKKKNLSHISH